MRYRIMEHSLKTATARFWERSDRHLHVRSGIMQRRMVARDAAEKDNQ